VLISVSTNAPTNLTNTAEIPVDLGLLAGALGKILLPRERIASLSPSHLGAPKPQDSHLEIRLVASLLLCAVGKLQHYISTTTKRDPYGLQGFKLILPKQETKDGTDA